MPDVWDEKEFLIRAALTSGSGKTKTAKFIFTQTGSAAKIPDAKADLSLVKGIAKDKEKKEKPVAVQIEVPRVPDGEDNYTFKYEIEVGEGKKKQKSPPSDIYKVWPSTIKIEGKKDPECKLDIPQFPFIISHPGAGESQTCMADQTLKLVDVPLKHPSDYTISTRSPYQIQWTKKPGRAQEATVSVMPWTAKIYTPSDATTEEAPLKQIVNAPGSNPSLLRVDIGPSTLTLGIKGQKIKVRVTFPKENAKGKKPFSTATRTDPFPSVWLTNNVATKLTPKSGAKPGEEDIKYETDLVLPADGAKATFYVQLGLGGGDRCKIEVGVTDSYGDGTLWVENWREIGLELFVADIALRQKCTKVLADSGAAFGTELKAELERIFEDTYIQFSRSPSGCVELAQADFAEYLKGDDTAFTWQPIAEPQHLFVAANKFIKKEYNASSSSWDKITFSAGAKIFLMSDYQQRALRRSKLGTARPKNTMTWVYCDFISDRSSSNLVGPKPDFKADMSKVKNYYITTFESAAEKAIETPFNVFEYDPIEADGKFGVIGAHWCATKWRKKGETAWLEVSAGLPGFANKDWAYVGFSTTSVRDKWIEIVDSINVKVKLPADSVTDPGKLIKGTMKVARDKLNAAYPPPPPPPSTPPPTTGTSSTTPPPPPPPSTPPPAEVDVEFELTIKVQINFYGVSFGTLGGAVGGSGQLRTGGGRVTVLGMAQTLAHEIAHNMGQTYTAEVSGEVGGCSQPEIDGVKFGKKFPAGPYYVGKGHQGSHCAKALLDVMASATQTVKDAVGALSYDFTAPEAQHKTDYFDKVKQKDQCIMYGDGPEMATETMDFCDTCKAYLRAVDLSDVSKSW